MRLINVHTLELKFFNDTEVPLYAILSHRWGESEITYDDFLDRSKRRGRGYQKIKAFCREVRSHTWNFKRKCRNGRTAEYMDRSIDWAWVDTCCIDKRNFTEYSEAINAMYRWYRQAAFCIVYMADVAMHQRREITLSDVRRSEWFSRGWTLQELLAPKTLLFFTGDWRYIGSSNNADLMVAVSKAARIDRRYLGDRKEKMRDICVAKRMSWAARRTTTKSEDLAYCLIGIFGISMTLIYGEGGQRAFRRLQEEIIRHTDDESIFTFRPAKGHDGVLASHPRDFIDCGNVIKWTTNNRPPFAIANRGLELEVPAIDVGYSLGSGKKRRRYAIELNCAQTTRHGELSVCTLGLRRKHSRYVRDIDVERAYNKASAEKARERFKRRKWIWTRSQRFYIHTERSGRSKRRREMAEKPKHFAEIVSKAKEWMHGSKKEDGHRRRRTEDEDHSHRRGRQKEPQTGTSEKYRSKTSKTTTRHQPGHDRSTTTVRVRYQPPIPYPALPAPASPAFQIPPWPPLYVSVPRTRASNRPQHAFA